MPCSIRYRFRQRFPVPANEAYNWCTDFNPEDHALMGEAAAKRQITRLTDTTIILTDVFHTRSGAVEKQKLVQLYRADYVGLPLT